MFYFESLIKFTDITEVIVIRWNMNLGNWYLWMRISSTSVNDVVRFLSHKNTQLLFFYHIPEKWYH